MTRSLHSKAWLNPDGSRVRGRQLDGDLAAILSLEEEAMPARRALIAMSWYLGRTTLVGNPAPIVAELYSRMREPRHDDLVVELTIGQRATHRQTGDWYRAIGVLILRRTELLGDDDEDPRNRATEDTTYIQYGPSPEDVCRWHNSEFAAVPWRRSDAEPWAIAGW